MMILGTHPLPDDLLIEIGRFASTWSSIVQTIVLHTSELYNFKHRYKKVERTRVDFRRLRQKWVKICKEGSDPITHHEIDALNERLVSASKARAYVLHGVWEQRSMPDTWNLNSGKEYRSHWWEQTDKLHEHIVLPVSLSDLKEQCAKLETLRLDLVHYLDRTHISPPTEEQD